MMLDLESCRSNACVVEKIEDGDAVEVADSNGVDEVGVDESFHRRPGLTNCGGGLNDMRTVDSRVEPAGWVADFGVHVFERNSFERY